MWQLNYKTFDSADDLITFIQTDDFDNLIKQMDSFDLVVRETVCNVAGHLSSCKPIWYDQDRLSDADWETTYEVSHLQSDNDPTEAQQKALAQLHRIEEIVNQKLNEG